MINILFETTCSHGFSQQSQFGYSSKQGKVKLIVNTLDYVWLRIITISVKRLENIKSKCHCFVNIIFYHFVEQPVIKMMSSLFYQKNTNITLLSNFDVVLRKYFYYIKCDLFVIIPINVFQHFSFFVLCMIY